MHPIGLRVAPSQSMVIGAGLAIVSVPITAPCAVVLTAFVPFGVTVHVCKTDNVARLIARAMDVASDGDQGRGVVLRPPTLPDNVAKVLAVHSRSPNMAPVGTAEWSPFSTLKQHRIGIYSTLLTSGWLEDRTVTVCDVAVADVGWIAVSSSGERPAHTTENDACDEKPHQTIYGPHTKSPFAKQGQLFANKSESSFILDVWVPYCTSANARCPPLLPVLPAYYRKAFYGAHRV